MKTISLHEKYQINQMKILLEELDPADMQNIARAFDRIDQILGDADSKLPSINIPMEKARKELSNMLSGEGGLLKRMFRGITGRQQTIMKSVMEAQIQLVSLFQALPSIMTIAGKNIKGKISQAGSTASVGEILKDDPNSLKNMVNLITKALKPADIGSTPINPQRAAQELMNLPVSDFASLSQRAGGAQLRVPVPKEDMQALQDKSTDYEAKEPAGRAQQLVADLTKGDKNRAKVMKALIDQLSGLQKKDIDLVKMGLDKFLGTLDPEGTGETIGRAEDRIEAPGVRTISATG